MSILIGQETRLMIQGSTGREATFHAQKMIEYGTKIVCGVTPGKGGQIHMGIPVFDTAERAVRETGANASIIFVPRQHGADAIMEAADSGVNLVVCITEGIPTLDMMKLRPVLKEKSCRLIGPNCPGLISPGKCKIGIMPGSIHRPGTIGVISRSGTLTYEVVAQLSAIGLGQSTGIGIGGDPIPGTTFVDCLDLFQKDPETQAIVMIGEIGGQAEEKAAEFIAGHITKPVVSFIAGQTAPPGRRMGHAGAIISGGSGSATDKIAKLRGSGITVVENPAQIGSTLASLLT